MATIIVDYENVRESGLKGVDILNEADTLVIFYSDAYYNITRESMDFIEQSNCRFETVKLLEPRSNALDFYQATYVGRVIEKGETQIGIITKDKGFNSIKDYVAIVNPDVQIVITADVQAAIVKLSSLSDVERRSKLLYRMEKLDLSKETIRINAEKKYKEQVSKVLQDSVFEDQVDNVYSLIENTRDNGRKKTYTTVLHFYGRQDGIKLYSLIKEVI